MEWEEKCPLALPEQLPALPAGWESGEVGLSSWSTWLGSQEEGILPAPLGQEVVEEMVGAGETLGVEEGKVEVEEMLRGVEGGEEVTGREKLEVVTAALPLPFPWLASSPPWLQLSLPFLLPPPRLLFLFLLLLLSSPLPPPPASPPASSSRGPLPVQIQLFFGGHPANFPRVDLDPDLIQVPRTIVPSSLFWPLKQLCSQGEARLGLGPCLHDLLGQTVLHVWGFQVLGQVPPCTSSCQFGVSLEPQEVGAQVWGLSQLLLPPLLLVASSCRGLLAVLGAVPETAGG